MFPLIYANYSLPPTSFNSSGDRERSNGDSDRGSCIGYDRGGDRDRGNNNGYDRGGERDRNGSSGGYRGGKSQRNFPMSLTHFNNTLHQEGNNQRKLVDKRVGFRPQV